jgi:nucleoside-diphosphate-sugar epimerase
MQKVFITGASGFVGSVLCRRLSREGIPIRAGVRKISDCVKQPIGCEVIETGDIVEFKDWKAALSEVKTVVHLASRVLKRRQKTVNSAALYRLVNIEASLRLARSAAAFGVRRFIYLSTVKVHGEEAKYPYIESSPASPKDAYAGSKWEAEQGLLEIGEKFGIEIIILRPPLVYGPFVKSNFYSLMQLIDKGVPLPFDSLRNRRSLVYVGNLEDAIFTCIDHQNAGGKIFMVSDGEHLSTPDLIRRLARAMGKPARLFPVPSALLLRVAKLPGRLKSLSKITGSLTVDNSKIRNDLEWTPPFSVEEGIRETMAWYHQYVKKL